MVRGGGGGEGRGVVRGGEVVRGEGCAGWGLGGGGGGGGVVPGRDPLPPSHQGSYIGDCIAFGFRVYNLGFRA